MGTQAVGDVGALVWVAEQLGLVGLVDRACGPHGAKRPRSEGADAPRLEGARAQEYSRYFKPEQRTGRG